jgi:hypothetical protein
MRAEKVKNLSHLTNLQLVSSIHHPTLNYSGKYPFLGHNTLAYQFIDSAPGVTLFTDLSDFQRNPLPHRQTRANRQGNQVNPLGGEVLGKITGANIEAITTHLVNAFDSQQTHLAMSAAIGMGIADKPELFLQESLSNIFFSCTLVFTGTDRNYLSHV